MKESKKGGGRGGGLRVWLRRLLGSSCKTDTGNISRRSEDSLRDFVFSINVWMICLLHNLPIVDIPHKS